MEVDITWWQLLTLLGGVGFGGMIIGALLVTGHSKNAFWEEE